MTMEGVFKLNKDLMEENAESMKKLYEINSQYGMRRASADGSRKTG